jgi:hypothetical protein
MRKDDTWHNGQESEWQLLLRFVPGDGHADERESVQRVTEAVQGLSLPLLQTEQICKAVLETLLRAIKSGHQNQPDLPVTVQIWISDACTEKRLRASSSDGEGGEQECRCWGLFLTQKPDDGPPTEIGGPRHLIELFLYEV